MITITLLANNRLPPDGHEGGYADKKDHEILLSKVERETEFLAAALQSFESSVNVSSGRPKNKEFHVFIIEIAEFFRRKLPDSAISKATDTNFSKVITYLLSHVVEQRLVKAEKKEGPQTAAGSPASDRGRTRRNQGSYILKRGKKRKFLLLLSLLE